MTWTDDEKRVGRWLHDAYVSVADSCNLKSVPLEALSRESRAAYYAVARLLLASPPAPLTNQEPHK